MRKPGTKLLAVMCALSLAIAFSLVGCSSYDEVNSSTSTINSDESSSFAVTDKKEKPAGQMDLQIFADSSLSEVLDELQALYTEQTGVSFADARYEDDDKLIRLLRSGTYADILFTGTEDSMDKAEEDDFIGTDSRCDMFADQLVIVAGADSWIEEVEFDDLSAGSYTLAVGSNEIPAGVYTRQALSTLDPPCWVDADGNVGPESDGTDGSFVDTPLSNQIVNASDVNALCEDVITGQTNLAIMCGTDASGHDGVKVVGIVPEDTHQPIVFPAAVCVDSDFASTSADFLDWAFVDEGAVAILQEHGFDLA